MFNCGRHTFFLRGLKPLPMAERIAASDLSGVTETGGTMTLTESQAESGAAGMARSFNAWGEDEEE